MIRVADYVIQFLEDYGVEDVFTVSGGGSSIVTVPDSRQPLISFTVYG